MYLHSLQIIPLNKVIALLYQLLIHVSPSLHCDSYKISSLITPFFVYDYEVTKYHTADIFHNLGVSKW